MPSAPSYTRSVTTDGRPKVLLMDPIQLATSVEADLAKKYDFIRMESRNRDEFIKDCSEKYDGVRAIYRHFKGASTKVTGLFDPPLVEALPHSLNFICHNGAGYDQIDIPSCTSRRIQVSNVPVAVDDATADTALFLLLGALRQFGPAQRSLYSGHFNTGLPLSNDPKGKLLGIVGMGGIGRAFAKRCRSLGMNVQYHNRNRLSEDLEDGATYVDSLEELLETSDVVSLNLPLNAKTKGLMGKKEFGRMKKTAILINTARGGVVNEQELVDALENGEIAGCGLDVYEEEPKINEGLVKSDKAFLLPHVGTLTVETQTEMEAVCLRNIEQGIETGKLGFTVPEQKGQF
ncbi:D-mandelate dehydrogenase-like dehydrogenase [Sporobolomyces salmoneus]|uniref:D-mandelate dehydrogenase-like dehydrogenase n=1 Tax=Sporobolomyces salmoneus TaxID=183962 RepID=UPI00317CA47E